MFRLFIASILLIQCAIGNNRTENKRILTKFMKYCEIPDLNKNIMRSLRKIISTKAGRELISKIINVYLNQAHIPLFDGCKLRDVIKKNNASIFPNKMLESKITNQEKNAIKLRNQYIDSSKEIIFSFTENNEFEYQKDSHKIIFNNKETFVSIFNSNKEIIAGDSEEENTQPRPIDVAIFHELLHCYHFLNDPVTFIRLQTWQLKQEKGYKCKFFSPTTLICRIDESWHKFPYIHACAAYLENPDNLAHIHEDTDAIVGLNAEELLTIRGKPATDYSISENRYRLERKAPLRFGYVINIKFDNTDERLYNEYMRCAKCR